jgi:AraC-like DNA-binding protein/mannose-6-phosphate isomerase-like protein (cupin superfamily)
MNASSTLQSLTQRRWGISRTDDEAGPHADGAASNSAVRSIEVSANWRQSDQFRLLQPQINAQRVHVWPFDEKVPIELHLLEGDWNRTVSKNRHDYFEIFVVCSGATSFIVEDRHLPMQPGDMAIVGSTLHHSTQCPPLARARIGALYFDPNFISGDGMAFGTEYLAPFLDQDPGFPHVVPAATGLPHKILDLMEMIQEEMPGSSTLARLAIKTYLKMILILLVKQYATYASGVDSFRQQQHALESLQRFFEFLPGHFGDMIYAPDAARMCDLSEAEFAAYLRQLTGCSFRGYLNQYRVERAQAALAETNHPISEIAQEMGFCDQSYFGAVFREFTGITPLAYRHQHRAVPARYVAQRAM